MEPSLFEIPPLESGDRLTREEFIRRYDAMPELKKAELIDGIVYMPAALRFVPHAEPHGNIIGWLWCYKIVTPRVRLGDNPTVYLQSGNTPQPDAVLLLDRQAGGQARINRQGYVEGAPELAVEIAASSSAIDLHAKKPMYCRNGVKEYLVWQVLDRKLSWFYLENGEYRELAMEGGQLRSRVFPGLWLAVPELLAGKMPEVLAVLQEGLASAEHQEFVAKLQAP